MRFLLTGGGSAGHVNPALAIAEALKKEDPAAEILFMGNENGMERELVSAEGYPMLFVKVQGLRRSFSLRNLPALYLALTATDRAKRLLRQYRPDAVIGTGGYVCYPALRAASALGIPTFLHEANVTPGLAVTRLARQVDRVFLNFEECAGRLPGAHTLTVGLPLRGGFAELSREEARRALGLSQKDFLLVSFGGSLGASGFNRAIARLGEQFSLSTQGVRHLHGYGKRNPGDQVLFEGWEAISNGRCAAKEYFTQIPLLLAAADLAITRAGAVTVAELAAAQTPAILIPSPHVPGDHQTANARVLSDKGAALLLREEDMMPEGLLSAVRELYASRAKRLAMRKQLAPLARQDAALVIARKIIDFCREISACIPEQKPK